MRHAGPALISQISLARGVSPAGMRESSGCLCTPFAREAGAMNETQRPTGPSPSTQTNPLTLDDGPAPVIPAPQGGTGYPTPQDGPGFPTWQPPTSHGPIPQDGTGRTFGSTLDQGLGQLQRSPLRRDSARGVIGGVCAGISERTGVSVVAVRAAAVLVGLFFGAGLGAYLLAWALLPDQAGTTHAEQAVRDGRPRSLVVLGLGALALMGILGWIFDSALIPALVAAGIVAYVVTRRRERRTVTGPTT